MVKVKTNKTVKKNPIVEFFISYPAVAIIILLLILFSSLSSNFLGLSTFQNSMKSNSYLLVAAIAETLIIMTGGIDLSVSTVMALSAVFSCMYMNAAGGTAASIVVAIVIALVVGLAFGIFNGVFVGYFKMQPFIVTMGTRLIASGVAAAVTNSVSIAAPKDVILFGFDYKFGMPSVFIIAMIVLVIMAIFVKQSKWGRELILLGSNSESARFAGINVRKVEATAYALSGLLSGFAGFLTIIVMGCALPTIGASNLLIIIGAVVLGGTSMDGGEGSVARTLIGLALLAILTAGLNAIAVAYTTQMIIEGIIIFIGYSLSVNVTSKSSFAVK